MKNLLIFIFIYVTLFSQAQSFVQNDKTSIDGRDINTVTTAVPFLMIAPDSRSGSMGDVGVATTPDPNSQHWNPAKYSFTKNEMGFSVSYTPWLRALIPDINLAYLAGYKKIDERQSVSASLLYFSIGDITFTNDKGDVMGQFSPNEFAIDAAYSRLFGDNISGAIALRYINSNLTGGIEVGGAVSHPGQSVAADVSSYYQKDIKLSGKESTVAFGINFSNVGAKISYTENADKDFIPMNLRLGGALTTQLDNYNSMMITADLNKLLVPTPPVYYNTNDTAGEGGAPIVQFGKDPNVSVPTGLFQSFYDAPAGGKEELREITYSVGLEYWYAKQFALRGGYFYEHATKGNRKFFTLGLGLRLNVFGLDFAYLIPTAQKHPLENTLRFTLTFDFEGFKKQAGETPVN